jgi:hypothetical protein
MIYLSVLCIQCNRKPYRGSCEIFTVFEFTLKLGVVVHSCNPSTQEAEDCGFEASLT